MSLTKATYSMIANTVSNVKDFGAVGDGTTDDTAAIQTALNSFGGTGGILYFPKSTYAITASLTVPAYVNLRGDGRRVSIIKKMFNGDMISAIGGYAGIYDMSLDGNGAAYTGKGVVVSSATSPSIVFQDMDIENCASECLLFSVANAGSTFRATNCSFFTLQTAGTAAAVVVGGTDTQATSRHFTNCESGGCTLFNFGGCNDIYVTGGYSNGLLFGAAGSKAFISNMRVGAAGGSVTVNGENHHFSNIEFGVPVVLNGTAHYLNSSCGVPSWNITDNSIRSLFSHGLKSHATVWQQASGTQPSLGDGTLSMYYVRNGNLVTIMFSLTMGATTTYGNNAVPWQFTLPYKIASATQYSNAALIDATSASTAYTTMAAFPAGDTVMTFTTAQQGVRNGFPLTWATGDQIFGTFSYSAW